MVGVTSPGIQAADVWKVPIKFSAKFTLAAGVGVVLPDGTFLLGIYVDHADFLDISVEYLIDSAWQSAKNMDNGALFDPRAQADVSNSLWPIHCDGVNVRLFNNGAGLVTNIIYFFVDE